MTSELIHEQQEVIPRLEPGDRLSREVFRQRYAAMTECKKAELIEGIVYMPSPVRLTNHGEPHFQLITWLGVYLASTPIARGADNATNRWIWRTNHNPIACCLFVLNGEAKFQ
ncbi:MAG TPA: hypothetical protein VM260_09580 [Pirellula sp.]|nr:hypothetical protein [Pirellula sp.]